MGLVRGGLGFLHLGLDELLERVQHGAQFAFVCAWNRLELGHQVFELAFASQKGHAELLHLLGEGKRHRVHLGGQLFKQRLHRVESLDALHGHHHVLQGTVATATVGGHCRNAVHDVQSFHHVSKHGVLHVQEWGASKGLVHLARLV